MEVFNNIGEGIAGLVFLFVGIRVWGLSKRSGQIADRLLSVAFLLWGFCYALYNIPDLLFYHGAVHPLPLAFITLLTLHLGSVTLGFFTRAVFRSRERWALWLVAGSAGCLIVGLTGSAWVGDWRGEQPLSNPWWWMMRVGSAIPVFWMGIEGLTQFGKARQRRQLGLCTPLVCNRYLLWGLAGSLWSILEIVDWADMVLYELTGQWSDALYVVVCWLEVAPGLLVALVFFPPAFYRRLITGAARSPQVVEG
jgi:hypothetical protein